MKFSDEVRQKLKATGKTQMEMVAGTGISQTTVSRFLLGGQVKSDRLDTFNAWADDVLKELARLDARRAKNASD